MELGLNNSTEKADNLITKIFSNLEDSMKNVNETISVWKEVLYSIKTSKTHGSQLADHSRIIEIKNDVLIVETDHPGRMQLFQMYKNYIINGINRKLPELNIVDIYFRLKKSENKAPEKSMEEIIREKLLADNLDEEFEKKYPSRNDIKSELPDDIKAIFERLKKA